jgi:hypothetical protein
MKKTIAKVVKHVRSHVKPDAHEDEPLVSPLPDDVPSHDVAFHEASDILHKLALTTPNLMGTAHGIALIHSAQKWVEVYGADEP